MTIISFTQISNICRYSRMFESIDSNDEQQTTELHAAGIKPRISATNTTTGMSYER